MEARAHSSGAGQEAWARLTQSAAGEVGRASLPERRRKVLSQSWRFMWRLHKPPGAEKMRLQKDRLGQVQLIPTLGGISVFSPGLQQCFPAAWAIFQRGGGSPSPAGECAVMDGGATACSPALEPAGILPFPAVCQELCPGMSLLPGAHKQRRLKAAGRPRCSRAACPCGVPVVLPRAEPWLLQPARGCSPLLAAVLALSTAGKGKLGDVANNLQQLKLHKKHLAWKIRQSRKNSTYHQYNAAEISFLEIIISDSSSKNKGHKLEEARKHGGGSESR